MTYKQLNFSSEAREKVLRGASVLADAVCVTLGPGERDLDHDGIITRDEFCLAWRGSPAR